MPFADQSRDLELARRQRAPRFVVRGTAARHPEHGVCALGKRRRFELLGKGACLGPDRHRLRVAVGANQALRQVDARPGCLPRPTVSVPASDRRLEGDPRYPGRALGEGDQPSPMGECSTRHVGDPFEAVRDVGEPGSGIARPAVLECRTDSGHHERHEKHALVDRRRAIEGVAAEHRRPIGLTGKQGGLRQAPERREDELDLAARDPELQGVTEFGGGRGDLATGQRHIPECPTRHIRAAAAALVDDGLAGASLGLDRVSSGPRHHRLGGAHHVCAMRLFDRIRRSALPRRSNVLRRRSRARLPRSSRLRGRP